MGGSFISSIENLSYGATTSSAVTSATNAGTTLTFVPLASLALSAGRYAVSGVVTWFLNGATCTFVRASLSTSSGGGGSQGDTTADGGPPAAAYNVTLTIPAATFTSTGATTVYLNGAATYSAGTPQYRCRISAIYLGP